MHSPIDVRTGVVAQACPVLVYVEVEMDEPAPALRIRARAAGRPSDGWPSKRFPPMSIFVMLMIARG